MVPAETLEEFLNSHQPHSPVQSPGPTLAELQAANKELTDLCKIGTFELCRLPRGHIAPSCKLVLKVKQLADGTPGEDKARMVVLRQSAGSVKSPCHWAIR